MSTTFWTDATAPSINGRNLAKKVSRNIAFLSGTAVCAVTLNAGAVMGLLYWASVFE